MTNGGGGGQPPSWDEQQQPYPPQGHGRQFPGQQQPRKGSNARLVAGVIGCGVASFLLVSLILRLGNGTPKQSATSPASATIAASAPQGAGKPRFPPETVADFRAFAATGDASQVHQVGSSSEGLPSCPKPNFYVTVSPGLTPKEVEADLSAFFVQQGLLGNQCGAFVFAFHSGADYRAHQNDGYTAGRVVLEMNGGASSQGSLEVDAGEATSVQAAFDFNF